MLFYPTPLLAIPDLASALSAFNTGDSSGAVGVTLDTVFMEIMRLVSRHEVAVVTTTPSACNVYCFASWIAYYSTNGLRHKSNVVFVPYAMQQVDGLLRRHVKWQIQ